MAQDISRYHQQYLTDVWDRFFASVPPDERNQVLDILYNTLATGRSHSLILAFKREFDADTRKPHLLDATLKAGNNRIFRAGYIFFTSGKIDLMLWDEIYSPTFLPANQYGTTP